MCFALSLSLSLSLSLDPALTINTHFKSTNKKKANVHSTAGASPFLWPRWGTLKTTQATMVIIINTLQVTQQEEGMGGNHTNIHGAFGDGQ